MKLTTQKKFLKLKNLHKDWQILIHHTVMNPKDRINITYFLTFRDHYEYVTRVAGMNYENTYEKMLSDSMQSAIRRKTFNREERRKNGYTSAL